jgi:hypothetical protein
LINYAKIIRKITGILKTRELKTHQKECMSVDFLSFKPKNAVINEEIPHITAIIRASNPRSLHPNTPIGVVTTKKKATGIIAGITK